MKFHLSISRKQSGFTLIEVLLVVTVMAIISTGAYSGLINIQRTARVNDTYSRFVNFLDLARSYTLNGKTVSGAAVGCPTSDPCVPKSFGVLTQDDVTCPTSGKLVVLFFEEASSLQFNTSTANHVLDSFCVDPKIQFQYNSGDFTTSKYFRYVTPFGIFDTTETPGSTTKITVDFCETGTSNCAAPAYSKTITLYSNVGVVE